MWEAPLYLEYTSQERMRELTRAAERGRSRAGILPSGPSGFRRRLARKLVRLGLHLDPQAASPPSHNGRPRLASR